VYFDFVKLFRRQTAFHHSNAAMARLYRRNNFHLIRVFQLCTDNELELEVFNDSLRLHLIYTVEHGSLFNDRTSRLITVNEPADYRQRWEMCLLVMTLS